jgi:membrane-associated phospholipid phosphatase
MTNPLLHYITRFKNWFTGIPATQRFQRQHPTVSGFISDRFDTEQFVGLPLTMLLVVGIVNVMLLSEIAESVVDAEWVVVVDQEFTNLLFSMRTDWLSVVMFGLTQLGEQIAVFAIGGLATLIFLFRKRYWALVAFWLAMAGVGLSVRFAKTFISRARPADVAYYQVEHYSFPSGHATTAMALFGLLAYFIYRHNSKNPYRKFILWAAAILILLVGFSRIYLGVHFLSDVLAGFILGFLWTLVGISLSEVMLHRKKRRQV